MSPLPSPAPLEALLDELWLDLDDLCRLAQVDAHWVRLRVGEGLLHAQPLGPGDAWRFDTVTLHRVRRMAHLERHFDAVPELAALVADLEAEVRTLQATVQRLKLSR